METTRRDFLKYCGVALACVSTTSLAGESLSFGDYSFKDQNAICIDTRAEYFKAAGKELARQIDEDIMRSLGIV